MKNRREISWGNFLNIWTKELTNNAECKIELFYYTSQYLAYTSDQVQISSTMPQFASSKIFVAATIAIQRAFFGGSEALLADGR